MSKLNRQEQGRSMVEMLGVLTVIGVLSIGGVMGYDYAMDKNKANNIADGIAKRAAILSPKAELGDGVDSDSLTAEFGSDDKIEGYSIGVEGYEESNGFDLTVEGLPKSLCKKLLDQGMSSASAIKLGTKLVWDKGEYDDSKATCAETGNNIVYEFNALLDSSEGSGKGPGDIEDSGECSESGYHWCTAGDYADSCQEDCCAGVTTSKCLTCSAVGVVSYPGNETACNYTGTNDGLCNGSGTCINLCAGKDLNECFICDKKTGTLSASDAKCESNEFCNTTGACITNPCANFTATTCTTGCTNNNGTADYTYVSAASNTPCKTTATAATNDGLCDGSGECEAAEAAEETCDSGETLYCNGWTEGDTFDGTNCVDEVACCDGTLHAVKVYDNFYNWTCCSDGMTWDADAEECRILCTSYADCGSGEYCLLSPASNGCTAPTLGVCKNIEEDGCSLSDIGSTGFRGSACMVDWWTAQEICRADGRTMVSLSDVGCVVNAESTCTSSTLKAAGYEDEFWTTDLYDSCQAWSLWADKLYTNSRRANLTVLCK